MWLLVVAACAAPKRTNMKGWELYCRKTGAGDAVTFVLLPGTNRLKSIEEIEQAPDRATSLDGARRLLATLAPGQVVVICVPREAGAEDRGYFRPWHNEEPGKSLKECAEACGVELGGFITW